MDDSLIDWQYLWYESQGNVETDLLGVETKVRGGAEGGRTQLIIYIGMFAFIC